MAKNLFEKVEAEVVKGAENYVEQKVKNKLIKLSEISALVLIGFILISIGLAHIIGYYYPLLNNGLNFLILGLILISISFMLRF